MKLTLILAIIIFILIAVIVFLYKSLKSVKKQNKYFQDFIERQKKNILYLYKHAEEITAIEKSRLDTETKIKESKSDEEILDIINAIISSNNDRLQDTSEGNNSSTSETTEGRSKRSKKSQ